MYIIFCDFDGTITEKDIVDQVFYKFSTDLPLLKNVELLWQKEKIGSQECLLRQLATIKANRIQIINYLSTFKLTEGFVEFSRFLEKKEFPLVILSDGFDLFIRAILKRHKINNYVLLANELENYSSIFWKAHFPYSNNQCLQCAHCKVNSMLKYISLGKKFIYIGDGLSDKYAAKFADVVFAKGALASYCEKNSVSFYKFNNFIEVKRMLTHLTKEKMPKKELSYEKTK